MGPTPLAASIRCPCGRCWVRPSASQRGSAPTITRQMGCRTHLALVLRGIGPAAEGGRRLAAAAMLQLKRMKAGKKARATQWWFMHLSTTSCPTSVPSKSAGRRGSMLVYDKQFSPMATLVGMSCCKSLSGTWP